MDDPLTALALAHRVESHEKRTKIIYITEADEQLALEQLLSAASQQQRRQQRGATGTQRGQPAAAALGGPAKQLPESVMDQLSVGYMKVEGGELRPVLLRTGGSKAKPWQRRWVTVEQLRAAIDIEYTSNAGKKAGMNSLEQRVGEQAWAVA